MLPRRPLAFFVGAVLVAVGAGASAAILLVLLGHVEHQPDQVIYALIEHLP